MASWVYEGGKIRCRWVEVGRIACASQCLKEAMNGSYLPPPPDFASKSPFGGPTMWFNPHLYAFADSEMTERAVGNAKL